MARTIEQGFRVLRSNLEITGLQEETVSTRQQNVREAVEADLAVLDTFLTGSYRRSTMIGPLAEADVDVFVVLDPKYYQAGPSSLLDKTKSAIKKKYPKTPHISPNGQAVTITFTDFRVDVVPGFFRNGGGYLIPDAQQGRWIETDPKKHVELWSALNKKQDQNFVPLLKMLKGWNKSRNLLRSFHLEVLAYTLLQNVTISSFPSGVRYVFEKSIPLISTKLSDPAGYSDDVAAYVNTQDAINRIVERITWASQTAKAAEAHAEAGQVSEAFDQWKLIFKDYFPAFG
jgi:hypothetical protein